MAEIPTSESTPIMIDDPEREMLRIKHQVRALTAEEEGNGIPWLPDGVYGFTSAVMQHDAPVFMNPIHQSFEVHKVSDGSVFTVGFVSVEDEALLRGQGTFVTIHLFPERTTGAEKLVAVQLAHVLRHREHSQRMSQGLEVELDTGH